MAERALILSAWRFIKGEASTKTPVNGEKAEAVFKAHQGRAQANGEPTIDVHALNGHLGEITIGIQGEWTVTVPSAAFREAMGNIGVEGAKPVTASGTFRDHDGKVMEATSEFSMASPSDGVATIAMRLAPKSPKLMESIYDANFGYIPPKPSDHSEPPAPPMLLTFGETQLPEGYTETVLPPTPQMEG